MKIKIKAIKSCSKHQHDYSDCGIACLVSIVEYYNGSSSFNEVRNIIGVTQNGISLLLLYKAANELGLEAKGYSATLDDIIEYNKPLILHTLNNEGYEHFIIFYGYQDDKLYLWDPAKGLVITSGEELEDIWKSKRCLALVPGPNFKTRKSLNAIKFNWIKSNLKIDEKFLISVIVTGVIISILGLTMAVYSQKLVDTILPKKDLYAFISLTTVSFLILSFRLSIDYIRKYILILQAKLFNIRIVSDFYTSILRLRMSFYDSRKTGDFVARLNDVIRIQRFISEIIGKYIIDLLVSISSLAILFYYSITTGIISVIILPTYIYLVNRWNVEIIDNNKSVMESYAINESNYINTVQGIVEIKAFNEYNHFTSRNISIFTRFQASNFKLGKLKIKLDFLIGMLGVLYMFILICINSSKIITGSQTIGELMAILTVLSSLLPSSLNLALMTFPINESKVAFSRMHEYSSFEKEDKFSTDLKFSDDTKLIELKDITFSYQPISPLLQNINISIEVGKITALFGESGTGKSTIGKIIQRFYSPIEGEIYADGIPSKEIDIYSWREYISYIPQEIHVFNGSILDNLSFYQDDISSDRIHESLTKNSLISYFERFPNGLNTIIGEGGMNLSGGEKQYLGFCRAILRQPRFLIIDEGSSAIDRKTEINLLNLIKYMKKYIGVLLITHKINIIHEYSDDIHVLEDMTIKHSGSHKKLLLSTNPYSILYNDLKMSFESNNSRLD